MSTGLIDAETLRDAAPEPVDGCESDGEILTTLARESPHTRPQ